MASAPAITALSIDRIFANVRVLIEEREQLLQKLTALETRLREYPDLFDADDLHVVTARRETIRASYEAMLGEFQAAMELYKRTIADIKEQIAQRESVLEKLDTHGLVSADTSILDFFTKKQAVFAFSVREAEQQLVMKINEKLTASGHAPSGLKI
jgi:DNA repair exonuclease SbcCD ATPase subunit